MSKMRKAVGFRLGLFSFAKMMIRDWATLGMAVDEKGQGEGYQKARRGIADRTRASIHCQTKGVP